MNWALTFPALSVTHGTVSVLGGLLVLEATFLIWKNLLFKIIIL